jgi:glucosamine--fructose-6-phosphate aminotransferase (isomerizing)
LKHSLQPSLIKQYKEIAEFFKTQDNIFMLAKGTGCIVSEYISQKFNQIACIHAEAYPSAEFRHGPLAMLDEEEKTACIFLILDDENLDQCLMNIM